MKSSSFLVLALALPGFLALPTVAVAQETPPAGFAAAEIARSKACVPGLTRLMELDQRLAPMARRADRIQALNNAIAMEDPERVAPFAEDDALEQAVSEWFVADAELGRSGRDASVEEERNRLRDEIRQRLAEALQAVNAESTAAIDAAENVRAAASECYGAVLVRSAVLEACGNASSVVCEEARAEGLGGQIRFVDAAEDLWDIEELRPWSRHNRLRPGPGGIDGVRTAALSRRGNLVFTMSLEAMLLERTALSEEQASEFDDHLSSLGFSFDSERFVMAPVLGIYFDATPEPLAGETHFFLHFGDLDDPANDVIWSGPATGGPVDASFAAGENVLARLVAGELVSLTAVSMEDGGAEGEAIYSLDVTNVGQESAVRGLLTYMAGGQLSRDLASLASAQSPGDR